jgi:hypothetical protein
LTETVTLYGFGSHFGNGAAPSRDVDLLIVHEDIGTASVQFAILCKQRLTEALPSVHVTMLSAQEERQLGFRKRCEAKLLGFVAEESLANGISAITARIAGEFNCHGLRKTPNRAILIPQ